MPCTVRPAGTTDIESLLDLMQRFHAESGFMLERESTSSALHALLANPPWGGAWLALSGPTPIGFATLAVRFAMEHEGLAGCIDDLYVEPAFRRHGVARRLLSAVIDDAALRGCKAMLVEAGASNAAALALYASFGLYALTDNRLLVAGPLPARLAPSP